jgi:crossover junction endodeoxyribonuclease RusA
VTEPDIETIHVGPISARLLIAPPPTQLRARLHLPYARPPKSLVGNSRAHWRQRSTDTQQVRTDVMRLAQQAGLHRLGRLEHITAELVWAPGDRRRRDADNLWPLLKVACDALARGPRRDWVGLELVPDDTPEHMTKLAPRIQPPPEKGMWLVLTLDFPKAGAA